MLRYSKEVNDALSSGEQEDMIKATQFFVATEIAPTLHDLRQVIDAPNRPWLKRVGDLLKVAPDMALAYLTMDRDRVIKSLATAMGPLFSELDARGDRGQALKRSGLYYILKLQRLKN